MSNSFGIKVIACDKIFYSGRCTQLVLPLRDGSKAIQAHHENMVFSVEVGEIKITKEDGFVRSKVLLNIIFQRHH